MAFHLGGFLEDQDPAGAFVGMAALADDRLFTQGDNLRVPSLNQVIMAAAGADTATASRVRLDSPTLDQLTRVEIAPLNGAAGDVEPGTPPAIMKMLNNPLMLGVDELLTCDILSNPAAAASMWALLWFADGSPSPVTGQRIFTVRGTGATTVTAQEWSTVALTLDENLPPGNYQVVGMRAEGATAVAARIIFRGGDFWRPGCLGSDLVGDLGDEVFRGGKLGVWGEFPFTQLPALEFLCNAADTAQIVHLDLVRVGG